MKNMIGKSVSGLIMLLSIIGALIFLPAWTVKYLQAWLYLLVFAISTILITIYLFIKDQKLLERRLNAGSAAEKEESQKVIQTIASVFFCSMYIIAGLDHHFNLSNIPMYISILANVFVILGFFIVFLVFKENTYTSAIIEVDRDQKVISTGMYGIVRHPMYFGAILMLVASAIALGSYWALLSVAALTFTIIARLLNEEKFLAKNLSGYNEYCEKVRYHLIPFIW
ncbi:isoprenylcysteine carboxylmethyltransferase family protein [Clostridium sp. C2-6-12]|uniref:methyltransferase family protein n=1 Tax=Clostridium sp. C2-6-12 TaxID=2698832 RepID=UPI00136FF113|nr:isoprenylcysteine carboxylmethyltransferase family protein [Clostridium sp. C2-6-12]